jgi:hypothetical protein
LQDKLTIELANHARELAVLRRSYGSNVRILQDRWLCCVETCGRYCESYNRVGCVAMKLWDEGENPARQMAMLWVSKLMVAIANRTIQSAVLR